MSGGSKTSGGPLDVNSEQTSLANPITYYKARTGKYPSNAEIWWTMKRPPELGSDEPPKIYLEVFDPSLRYQIATGNAPAPKGHFVLEAFDIDRSKVSGVSGISKKTSKGARPSAIAFYAGRVWYAGAFSEGWNTKVYFSPVIERPDQVQQAYQDADPTAEDIRDLLPSDGGVIDIREVSQVYNLVPLGPFLFVFADNGVWQIGGSEGAGFRANDFSVSKLSGVPTISNLSFVYVQGTPFWWNRSGIFTFLTNEQGQLQVQSITENTIQTFYDELSDAAKLYAKGAYDPVTKLIQWVYNSGTPSTLAEKFTYDSILTFNTVTGAFSPWTPADHYRVEIKGIFDQQGKIEETQAEAVTAEGVAVTADSVAVTASTFITKIVDSKIKYILNLLDEENAPEPPEAED